MNKALVLYFLFLISHNNSGVDVRQYGMLRALQDTERAQTLKT